jgi:hypothetical protein
MKTWRHVDLLKTNVSEERVAYLFRIEQIHERGKALAIGATSQKKAFFIIFGTQVDRQWLYCTVPGIASKYYL